MSIFWGTATYSDGARVVARREKCRSNPVMTPGTHTCRQHVSHEGLHRCICGKRWGENRRVVAS